MEDFYTVLLPCLHATKVAVLSSEASPRWSSEQEGSTLVLAFLLYLEKQPKKSFFRCLCKKEKILSKIKKSATIIVNRKSLI